MPCNSHTVLVVHSKWLSCSNARSLQPRKCAPNLPWPRLQRGLPKLIIGRQIKPPVHLVLPELGRSVQVVWSPLTDRRPDVTSGGADGDAINLRDLLSTVRFPKVLFFFVRPACSTNRLGKNLVDLPVEMTAFIHLPSCPRVSRFLHSACPYINSIHLRVLPQITFCELVLKLTAGDLSTRNATNTILSCFAWFDWMYIYSVLK